MSEQAKYRTIRIREEDFQKLKAVQAYLRKKGTENIDWIELKKQNVVEISADEEDEGDNNLTWSFILGLGAASLAYLIWKNSKK